MDGRSRSRSRSRDEFARLKLLQLGTNFGSYLAK